MLAIRLSGRKVVLEASDARAYRESLNARPRVVVPLEAEQVVYIWRRGKSQGYKGGRARWYGPAVLVGRERQNW